VKDVQELERAVEVAFHYDDKILVENGIENLIEITLPLMGNAEVRPAECERPLNKTEFFDFKDKYLSGGGKKGASGVNNAYSEIPAQIGAEKTKLVKAMGVQVYKTLGLSGTARVDFLLDGVTDALYVNEVNTLPGSLYHHNWKKAGVSNMDLVLGLVQLAEERFAEEKNKTFAFESDILQKVGGGKMKG
jgi:D-alanine-D-alanine ligase